MNWTQPICEACWTIENQNCQPVRVIEAEAETCAFCGTETRAGIYVRTDPRTVAYPKSETHESEEA